MDAQALTDLHADLQAQGFKGALEGLSDLLSKAAADTQKRIAMSYWVSAGLRGQAALVNHVYVHAQKHRMEVLCPANRPGHLTVTCQRPGPAVRLAQLDIEGDGARLLFIKDGEFVGERNICWE